GMRWRRRSGSGTAPAEYRFNWATAGMRWRRHLRRGRERGALQLQLGHRWNAVETPDATPAEAALAELQLGHRWNAVETAERITGHQRRLNFNWATAGMRWRPAFARPLISPDQ